MQRIGGHDGANIVLHSTGDGPGIVVVHGGGVTVDVYRRLAAALAGRFTVYLYNRRGRADAAPRSLPYRLDEDVADLTAVLEQTGTGNVLAHSGGALVAMRAALEMPVDRLALYDPVVPVAGALPTAWVDRARTAARAGDLARAMALTGAGLNGHTAAAKLPIGLQVLICRLFLSTPIGRTMGELLPMTLDELEEIRRYEGPADRWAGITADVLLACGADGPAYYRQINAELARALPRARTVQIPRSGHDAVGRARRRLVEPLAAFFGERVARTPS
jgi:pimeloyl-ACP methyl ester carboxylesterase